LAVGLILQRTLAAAGDPRAWDLLAQLRTTLQRQAARIDDVDLQAAFANNIRTHREIVQSYADLDRMRSGA
jgi:hypothetical protein